MYTLIQSITTGEICGVSKHENGIDYLIPNDPTNTDYQAFLAWIAEGNAPNPYVPPPAPPEPTIEEKLASVGLSIDDLKTALGIK